MILSRPSHGLRAPFLAAALTLVACSSADDGPVGVAPAAESAAPAGQVVATTSIWADVASEVLCGADVVALVPPGADPHSFEPSLQDRAVIEGADLVIANGGGLEGALDDLIDAGPAVVVEIMDHVDIGGAGDGDAAHDDDQEDVGTHDDAAHDDAARDETDDDERDHDDDEDDHDDDGHDHGGIDPHVWQDPTLVASALDAIADAGAELGLDDCSDDYADELSALDAEIAALVGSLPTERRIMVTSHDALGHFADRYGFEIVGTVIPANNTLAETNAADLARLSDVIEARSVGVVFTEELESTVDADALAERLGVGVVPLVTDALTDDPATDTYVEMMRSNAEAITTALSP